MALTLNGGIDATTREIRVSGSVPGSVVAGYLFRVDDEVMEFQTFRHQWPDPVDTSRWRVRRGVGTSVAASHSNGATLFGARDAYTSSEDQDQPSPFPDGGAASTPTLAEVLAEGADGNAVLIANLGGFAGPTLVDYANTSYIAPDGSGEDIVLSGASGNADVNGGSAKLLGGGGNNSVNAGAELRVKGGGSSNTGGDIQMIPGTGSGGRNGLIFANLPTVDPAVAGALWADNLVVKVSAG